MRRALAMLLLLVPSLAWARPSREAVERLLSGYEVRAEAADFARLGEGVDEVLIAIALEAGTPPVRRLRALVALGMVPTSAGRALCRAVIRDERGAREGREVLEVGACAATLGAFGPSSAADLVPLLSHPSSDVRLGAARGLARAAARETSPALRRRLAVEPDESVREALAQALRALPR